MDHPNISKLYFAFADAKRLYFVMELISGGDLLGGLAAHLRSPDHVPMEVARFYMSELVSAIGYIHSKNIVHRDLVRRPCFVVSPSPRVNANLIPAIDLNLHKQTKK